MISVLILTKNEQKDLPECLRSVAWCDDIIVYDSYSTDDTVGVAERFGARVVSRHFDNWSSHQNWGLRNLPFKHPWVFYIDADERMTPELVKSVQAAAQDPGGCVAFRVQRRDFFQGAWLKHVQAAPFYMRLFLPEKMRYERLVNPLSIADGQVGSVTGFLDHFPFIKGIGNWLERHNSYSTLEARQIMTNRREHADFSFRKAVSASDPDERKFHQKELFYRMPFRAVLKFGFLYVIKRGFLDGRAGLTYALLRGIYEYMIVLKVREMEIETE